MLSKPWRWKLVWLGHSVLIAAAIAYGSTILVAAVLAFDCGWAIGHGLDRLMCRIGVHDWRGGPGRPCRLCGAPDDLWERP